MEAKEAKEHQTLQNCLDQLELASQNHGIIRMRDFSMRQTDIRVPPKLLYDTKDFSHFRYETISVPSFQVGIQWLIFMYGRSFDVDPDQIQPLLRRCLDPDVRDTLVYRPPCTNEQWEGLLHIARQFFLGDLEEVCMKGLGLSFPPNSFVHRLGSSIHQDVTLSICSSDWCKEEGETIQLYANKDVLLRRSHRLALLFEEEEAKWFLSTLPSKTLIQVFVYLYANTFEIENKTIASRLSRAVEYSFSSGIELRVIPVYKPPSSLKDWIFVLKFADQFELKELSAICIYHLSLLDHRNGKALSSKYSLCHKTYDLCSKSGMFLKEWIASLLREVFGP